MGSESPEEELHRSSPVIWIRLPTDTIFVNKKDAISKSAKLAEILKSRPGHQPVTSYTFPDMPADVKTFQVAVRFFLGRDPDLSPDNVIPAACLADYLEMTEEHCPGNLLHRALSFFSSRVLNRWNETLQALGAALPVLDYATRLGLIDACLDSITAMVTASPGLLNDPAEMNSVTIGVKRRLFQPAERSPAEDLSVLHPLLYIPAMRVVIRAAVPDEYVARCLYRHLKLWAHVGTEPEGESLVSQRTLEKDVIEAVERLLPEKRDALHVSHLFGILRRAIFLDVSSECRHKLELRIARQLPWASAEDLFVPQHGYTIETEHDVECTRRILGHFCSEPCPGDMEELVAVAELVEGFLPEAAKDINLKKETFASMAGVLAAVVGRTGRKTDGVYRAVDSYLVAHGHLTQAEREEVCRVLDVRRLSTEACEHAARNERLPIRVVTQVLLVEQLRIREAIASVLEEVVEEGGEEVDGEEEEEEDEKEVVVMGGGEGVVVKMEEVERCKRCGGDGKRRRKRKEEEKKRLGFWREMVKWKLGCKEGSALDDCRCYVKKVHHKKNGV